MRKRQRRTIGSIVEIPVDGYRIHAQILPENDMVFFDTKEIVNLSVGEIVSSEVLFRISVNSDAILDGRWPKIGKFDLRKEFLNPVPRFIQDQLNKNKFEIYLGGNISPATRKDCEGLDRCAVWAVNHVEDRIKDYYNNVPNCSGLMEPDTLMRDNNSQSERCHNERKTNLQAIPERIQRRGRGARSGAGLFHS